VPFLRLTRDRRGFENTFLLHSDHAGGRPRLLYWYRTAPGVALGRPPLDEEAIHTIEDNHPDIDFDWPAILALREVMTPEEEAVPTRPKRKPRRDRDEVPAKPAPAEEDYQSPPAIEEPAPEPTPGLLEELVGREIAARLRARYEELRTLVDERVPEPARESRLREIAPLDPDDWSTPQDILDGVSRFDALFDRVRTELAGADG
jgi:hypothetical protein